MEEARGLGKIVWGEADFVINRFCIWLVFLAHTSKQSMKGCKARGYIIQASSKFSSIPS